MCFLKNSVIGDRTCVQLVQSAPWQCFCGIYFEKQKIVLGEKKKRCDGRENKGVLAKGERVESIQ